MQMLSIFHMGLPSICYPQKVDLSIRTREKIVKDDVVSVPVIEVGRMNDPALMLSALRTRCNGFCSLGGESVYASSFTEKIKEGRLDEDPYLYGCAQRCLYPNSFEEGFGISCMINPFSWKRAYMRRSPGRKEKKIAGA